MLKGGLELAPLVTSLRVNIEDFKSDMEKAKIAGVAEAKKLSSELSGLGNTGEKMEKIGGSLTKAVTLPLVGAGTAALKMGVDFETSFAKVSTLLDDNRTDFDSYKRGLLEASNESKVAIGEFSEAVYGSISAGVDQKDAIEFTTNAMKLAKGGFTDGAKAVDVLTTAINGYKMSTEDTTKISDLLITTQNLGKTTVDQLASSMGKVIPIAAAANFNIEELSAAYAVLTKNGIATAEAGTYTKAMLSEITKAGSMADMALRQLTGKGFAGLKKEGMATTDILKMLDEVAQQDNKTLKDMFGSVEAGSAALVLANSNGEEYNEMLKAMEDSAGATQSAFEKMDATPAEKMAGALNKLKNAGIKLGAAMLPIFDKVADVVDKLADRFSKLDEEQMSSILRWGALAAAAGPALKVVGKGIGIYTKLAPAIAGATAAVGAGGASAGFIGSLGSLAVAAAPAAIAVAAVGAAGVTIAQKLSEEVIPEVDLFKDAVVTGYNEMGQVVSVQSVAISEATKRVVGDYIDASDRLLKDINALYFGAAEISEPAINNLGVQAEGLAQRINDASSVMKDKEYETLTTMFSQNSQLTTEQQGEILKVVDQAHIDRQNKTNDLKDQLLEIYDEIKNGTGEITEQQRKDINDILDQMKQDAIDVMADSKIEQEAILGQLKLSHERVNTEMVSDAITQMNDRHKETVRIAGEEYKARLRVAENLRKEGTKEAQDAADAIIKEAERQYTDTVDYADKIRDEGLAKLDEAYGDLTKNVDKNTGEILTAWQKVKNWWSGTTFEKKAAIIEYQTVGGGASDGYYSGHSKYSGFYNGLDFVPYDGFYARLHKGERVLTAEENKKYNDTGGISVVQNIYAKVEDERLMQREALRNLRELLPQV